VISDQVSFSLLDRRAAGSLSDVCRARGVKLLAYGTLAGGWLSDRWLGRPEPDWERRNVRNDDSVVLELRYGDVSVVLPGDISREVERDLADRIGPAPFRVLKAPHHGSASSSSDHFLDAIAPSIALVSCGRDNRFGHPAPAVLARYAARRLQIFRTDRDGEIDLSTDGHVVEVTTFTGRHLALVGPSF